jgi:hypothetical protein
MQDKEQQIGESENAAGQGNVRRGIASLFGESELKSLFKKYLVWMIIIEAFIFFVCWVYQLGIDQFSETGQSNVPFPWKIYFLVAFLAPIMITFLLGIITLAFNKYIYGTDPGDGLEGDDASKGGRIRNVYTSLVQLPFLLSLLLLAGMAGAIYNLDTIMLFLGRFGEASIKVIFIVLGVVGLGGSAYGLIRMVLNYKLRKQTMDYEYKRDVMDRLGVAVLDDKTVVTPQGRIIDTRPSEVRALPQSGEGDDSTFRDLSEPENGPGSSDKGDGDR